MTDHPPMTGAELARLDDDMRLIDGTLWDIDEGDGSVYAQEGEAIALCDMDDWIPKARALVETMRSAPRLLAEVRRLRAEMARREEAHTTAKEREPDVPNTWLNVDGQTFACTCGCKIFHQHDRGIPVYHCNGCGAVHEGMPK